MYLINTEEISIDEINEISNNMQGISIYTQNAYLKALSAIRPIKCYIIRSNNKVTGVFPVIDRKRLFIRYAPQPPFTQYFGIMVNKGYKSAQKEMDSFDRTINCYTDFLNKQYRMFLLPQHYDYSDMRPFIWKRINYSILYTYHFHVNRESIAGIDRRIRNKDTKTFTVSNDIESVYRDIRKAYNGKPPIDENDCSILMKNLLDRGLMHIYRNDEAAVCLLMDEERKTLYEYIAAGHNTGRLIRDIFAQGLYDEYTFDFQGANTKSIARYKALFNPELKQYFCIRKRI